MYIHLYFNLELPNALKSVLLNDKEASGKEKDKDVRSYVFRTFYAFLAASPLFSFPQQNTQVFLLVSVNGETVTNSVKWSSFG